MLFNSFEYALFLPLVLIFYFNLRHRGQNWLLLGASYFFYGVWDWRFLSLILISTAVDFVAGLSIDKAQGEANRPKARRWLLVSLGTNLGILGFFKYFNFFTESAASLLTTIGAPPSWPLLNIILPVGISFYTFQTLSYTLDIYKGQLKPTRNLLNFALFVAFFPQLVAGPIERARTLLPQIEKPRIVTQTMWERGLYLILVGLIRKVVIADTAGVIAERYFADPTSGSSIQLAAALLLYALQIYGDFAGYSNMARGSALLLGVDLMRNFRHPYFAVNIADFWRRWHISLTTWFRDYVYIPLGGNRRGSGRTLFNLMVTMLLSGLWHGASWNFVVWGGLHGVFLAVHRLLRGRLPDSLLLRSAAVPFTFALAVLAWLPFRLVEFSDTLLYLRGLSSFTFGGELILLPVLFLYALILAIDLPQAITDDEFCYLRLGWLPGSAVTGGALLLLILMMGSEAPFIYFQF